MKLASIAAEIAASGRDVSPGVKMMIEDGLPSVAVISLDDRRRARSAEAPTSRNQEATMPKTATKKAAPKKTARASARKTTKATTKTAKATAERRDGLRAGSKQAMMVDIAFRKGGATEAEICAKLGWKKCRVTLKRVCDRIGAVLSTSKNAAGVTVYHAAMPKT